ncbi:hypothetical protein B0T22DRAFT_479455 [Podospora appendiculata]|uniref:Uncharacterized protein n=1 Tax=Podospora appendiculata TaxID=314037 RepID=A0AAE1CC55_9PEZI|nr:hypothetical protein B0T22DRAFT_479455 [Podospora appendiculata]
MASRRVKLARVAAVLSIAACGAIGIYGAIIESLRNGFFDVIHNTVGGRAVPADRYIPGAPEPLKLSYTGVAPVDGYLLGMIGFFSPFLDGERTWDVDVSYWYIMVHLCAGWVLMSVEGMRKGNAGLAVSWTGVMGLIFQSVTYTVTVPVWLIMHLLTSPVAKGDPAAGAVDAADMALLPACAALAFIFPAIMMNLPSPSVLPAASHYGWIAFWNAFPLWQSIHHWVLRRLVAPSASAARMAAADVNQRPGVAAAAKPTPTARSVYKFILALCATSQLALLGLALTPYTAVPAGWAPGWTALFKQVDLSSAFVPTLPRGDVGAVGFASFGGRRVPGDFLPPLAKIFLQWDVYSANAAMLIWAVYVYGVSRSVWKAAGHITAQTSGLLVAVKSVGWFLVGGPVATATFLLWERDEAAVRVMTVVSTKKTR